MSKPHPGILVSVGEGGRGEPVTQQVTEPAASVDGMFSTTSLLAIERRAAGEGTRPFEVPGSGVQWRFLLRRHGPLPPGPLVGLAVGRASCSRRGPPCGLDILSVIR